MPAAVLPRKLRQNSRLTFSLIIDFTASLWEQSAHSSVSGLDGQNGHLATFGLQ